MPIATAFRRRARLLAGLLLVLACGGGGGDKGVTTVNPPPATADFTDIAIESGHACGISGRGYAFCWGSNASGMLGTTANLPYCDATGAPCSTVPIRVELSPRVKSIAVGQFHSCALTVGGDAYCWGANNLGQLGSGSQAASAIPVAVVGGLQFRSIVAASSHTCAIATSGETYCWGLDDAGQLGVGGVAANMCGTAPCSFAPVKVAGGHQFTMLALRDRASCGLTVDGAEFCWGKGVGGTEDTDCQRGRSADCARTPIAVDPTATLTSIAMSTYINCGLATTGVLRCWGGSDPYGMLGNGTVGTDVTSPAVAANGATWTSFVEGTRHVCALDAAGAAKCWGYNGNGELGMGSTSASEPQPVAVVGGQQFTALVSNGDAPFTCGLTTDLHAMCWGWGGSGELGNGQIQTSASPIRVKAP